jgi:pyruvate-ferredoxin/flavodoxin oxidoreductase
VVTSLAEAQASGQSALPSYPRIIGGRYGLSSKEFTPAMVKAVFDELGKEKPKNHFTVGIVDDVTNTSLDYDPDFSTEDPATVRALFYGLGSDGTVGANKNSIKIIGEDTDNFAQGYFVYDSKKAGAITISHLRFGPKQIRSTYLISKASFVACHQFSFLERFDMLKSAEPGAVFLLNSIYGTDEVWDRLPRRVQEQIISKKLKFYIIDAYEVAKKTGMGVRINTIMQTCFFAISGVLPREEAIASIKMAIEKTYGKRGEAVVKKNFAAVDAALDHLHEVKVPDAVTSAFDMRPPVPEQAPEFVQSVLGRIIAGDGDSVPVSGFPVDGTFPTATTQWEKRNIALEIPVWDEALCIQCGKCVLVCPHAVIRAKVYAPALLDGAPAAFKSASARWKEFKDQKYSLQVAPEDCTGCALCVAVCPVKSKTEVKHKAINMAPQPPIREQERANWDFFLKLPEMDRGAISPSQVKDNQLMQPLFEFSGACAGCGETPYIGLLTRLFGDRTIIGNATGCSSIYGGNLPTTPYCVNEKGLGPAWSNSLFEDNAEFGMGIRLAIDAQNVYAKQLLKQLAGHIGDALVEALLNADQSSEEGIKAQRERVALLKDRIRGIDSLEAHDPARPRHRGLLEHRRPDVEGDAARRGRQVRLRRQAEAQEGPGHDGDDLRQRVRGQGGHGRQRHANGESLPRSRGVRRSVADHRLQPLHCPRLRPCTRPRPAEGSGAIGVLAHVPLQSGSGEAGQESAPARLAGADPASRQVHLQRDPLHDARPQQSGSRQGAAQARPGGCREALETVRAPGIPARRRPAEAGNAEGRDERRGGQECLTCPLPISESRSRTRWWFPLRR